MTALAAELEGVLRPLANAERAAGEKKYLKSELVHLGVPGPVIRKHVSAALRARKGLARDELVAAAEALWASAIHELRFAAIELLCQRVKLLGPADAPLVERLLRESRTWAFVDVLATHVMGPLFVRDPGLGKILDRWAKDDDFWLRRSAMLALLVPLREGGGDFARFTRYADAMLEEREFFIRKAIGWILRATARLRPDLVFEWLAPRAHRASGVTMREAVKYLSAAQRARLSRTEPASARARPTTRSGSGAGSRAARPRPRTR